MKQLEKMKRLNKMKQLGNMKRFISITLALVMMLAMAPNVTFAEPETADEGAALTQETADAGTVLTPETADAGTALTPQASTAGTALTPFQAELQSKYTDPDRVYSTDVRWWLGSASHTVETLMEEIQALYDGGFRGAELCMQSDGDTANNSIYAYGSAEWAYKWKLMMNKLLDLGMGVYLTSGTNWATANVPWNATTREGLDPDSQAASQSFMLGIQTVDSATSVTSLPIPTRDGENAAIASSRLRDAATFLGAYAYKYTSTGHVNCENMPQSGANASLPFDYDNVDYDSVINLTPLVTQGANVWDQKLNWTAPPEGTWKVFAYWVQGTAQSASPAVDPCYAINYYDERGIDALKTFWTANYLDDPDLNAKILGGDVQLFMDSLEINFMPGVTWWVEDMPEQFQARKGYDILPYMFLLFGVNRSHGRAHILQGLGYNRLEGNEILTRKIVDDYLDVLSTLYMERMLAPLKTWLNSYGIKTRAQISYGRTFEITEPAMYVDYPETENLNFYNQVDQGRLFSGGAKLQNKVLSSELCTSFGYGYSNQLHFRSAYSHYAAGGQRVIWHVWGAGYGRTDYQWPGNHAGGSGHFRWGARHPIARDYDELNAHLGRIQQLMQTGKARSDVGFLHNNWNNSSSYVAGIENNFENMNHQLAHLGIKYRSTELQDNGYTYDYFSPKFLYADDVYFDEETKTIEQAGYKAIVLYTPLLDIKGAQRLLEWAKKGLKVVILDDAASYTIFNDGKDAELAAIIAELKTLPTVRTATTVDKVNLIQTLPHEPGGFDNNVYEMLQELGVRPYAEYVEPNYQLLTQSRIDDDGNMYLYVYNYCSNDYHQNSLKEDIRGLDHGTNIKTEIKMDGMFIPYSIDAWSGKVTQLANYRYEDGQTVFPIDLDYDNIALFAFEAVNSEMLHIVSTDAESAYASQNGLVVRATNSGAYTANLSNGGACQCAVTVPAPYDITNWDLTVESWTANPTAGDLTRSEPQVLNPSVMTIERKTSTVKTNINVNLPTLTTWNNIPDIGRDHSGYGHYEASFNWDADKADGAYLDLGDTLVGSMKVWINGVKVGGDISTNPTKAKKSVGVAVDGVIPEGKDQYTGGVSWMKSVNDIGAYLVDGANEIIVEYSSDLTNRMLQMGRVSESFNASIGGGRWWGYNLTYRNYGLSQAVLVPYVDISLTHTLTVTNGSGSGSYLIGAIVTATADKAPSGQQFNEWVATGMELTEQQASQNPLTFKMPESDVSLTALYSPVPATPTPPPKGNYGGSQGKGVSLVTPTPIPTPSEAPGEELSGEPGGEPGGEPSGEPAPTQPEQTSKPQSSMADIAPDYWAAEFIDGLMALGIVDGYPMPDGSREYRPENNITRLEMAKLIVASLELELIYDYDGSDTFADWFDVQEWGRPYMAAAIEAGIVLGSAEEGGLYLFPDDNIIREEMIAMSVRALGAEAPEGGECNASDFETVSEWAMDDVAFAVENEMINLRQGNVAPGSNATRAESAMILYKLLEYLGM